MISRPRTQEDQRFDQIAQRRVQVASSGYQALYFGFTALYHASHVWRRHLAEDIAKAGQRGIVGLAVRARANCQKML